MIGWGEKMMIYQEKHEFKWEEVEKRRKSEIFNVLMGKISFWKKGGAKISFIRMIIDYTPFLLYLVVILFFFIKKKLLNLTGFFSAFDFWRVFDKFIYLWMEK